MKLVGDFVKRYLVAIVFTIVMTVCTAGFVWLYKAFKNR